MLAQIERLNPISQYCPSYQSIAEKTSCERKHNKDLIQSVCDFKFDTKTLTVSDLLDSMYTQSLHQKQQGLFMSSEEFYRSGLCKECQEIYSEILNSCEANIKQLKDLNQYAIVINSDFPQNATSHAEYSRIKSLGFKISNAISIEDKSYLSAMRAHVRGDYLTCIKYLSICKSMHVYIKLAENEFDQIISKASSRLNPIDKKNTEEKIEKLLSTARELKHKRLIDHIEAHKKHLDHGKYALGAFVYSPSKVTKISNLLLQRSLEDNKLLYSKELEYSEGKAKAEAIEKFTRDRDHYLRNIFPVETEL